MKLTVIDNYDSFVYNIVRYLREGGCDVQIMRNDQIQMDLIETCDGIVLSPGPGIPQEAGDLLHIIDQFHLTKPMLGICLGHQALGGFFGAELKPANEIIHGKSSQMNILQYDPIFQGMETSLQVGRYHSWGIEDLPKELIKTSEGPKGEVMSFRHHALPIAGLQFHPESILTPQVRTMINNWLTFYVQPEMSNLTYRTHENLFV